MAHTFNPTTQEAFDPIVQKAETGGSLSSLAYQWIPVQPELTQ